MFNSIKYNYNYNYGFTGILKVSYRSGPCRAPVARQARGRRATGARQAGDRHAAGGRRAQAAGGRQADDGRATGARQAGDGRRRATGARQARAVLAEGGNALLGHHRSHLCHATKHVRTHVYGYSCSTYCMVECS